MGQREGLSFWDRNGLGSVYGFSDLGPIRVNDAHFAYDIPQGQIFQGDIVEVRNDGLGDIDYTITNNDWVWFSPPFGTASPGPPNQHQLNIDTTNLDPGTHVAILYVRRFDDWNSAQIAIELEVLEAPISIPDPQFKAYLVANFDTSNDGEIQPSEA